MALQPQCLAGHPLCGHTAVTVELKSVITGCGDLLCLLCGAYIHPDQAVAQRRSVLLAEHDGAAGHIISDRYDVLFVDARHLHGSLHALLKTVPPVHGALFCPARMLVDRLIFRRGKAYLMTVQFIDANPDTACAHIESHYIFF